MPPFDPPDYAFEDHHGDLWDAFRVSLEALGGKVATEEEVRELLSRKSAWADECLADWVQHPAVDPWTAEVGLTQADAAVAHTGSLLVRAGDGRTRLSSLAPPHNIIFTKRGTIRGTLDKGLSLLSSRSSALITGPSRTADIEGILVRGVHGPGILWVLVEDDEA
jgi:L-lactate utilization protein LutC